MKLTAARLNLLRHVQRDAVRVNRSFAGGASAVVVDLGPGAVRRYRTVTALAKTLIEGGLITVGTDSEMRWSSPVLLTDAGSAVLAGGDSS